MSRHHEAKDSARLVAKGYGQKEELIYNEVSSLVDKHISIQILHSIILHVGIVLDHLMLKQLSCVSALKKGFTWSNQKAIWKLLMKG